MSGVEFYYREITVRTERLYQLVDITREVERAVEESGVRNGLCLVYAPHATAAIVANEHESGLMEDILRSIQSNYPRRAGWKHDLIDDNAAAHLGSAFIGADRVFPVINGRLIRGTWQNIFLVEMDGPRHRRRLLVCVLGQK